MNDQVQLQPFAPDAAALGEPLPFDLYTDRGVLVSRSGSVLSDQRQSQLLESQQLFRATSIADAGSGDCALWTPCANAPANTARIASVWGCEARDAQRIDAIAQNLIHLVRWNSALCMRHGDAHADSAPCRQPQFRGRRHRR